jgi:hypothetical protein
MVSDYDWSHIMTTPLANAHWGSRDRVSSV